MAFLTPFQARYGVDTRKQALLDLQAGPLTVKIDGIDVRYVKLGDIELVRRIYVAVRDRNWNTIPATYEIKDIRRSEDSFSLDFEVRHQHSNLDFRWDGRIIGEENGTIRYEMDGKACSNFPYNRIGFCVLHPVEECAGKPFRAVASGQVIHGMLPKDVRPQVVENNRYVSLIPACQQLIVQLDESLDVQFNFEGDVFEMEDQRNWTDASFKTYGTPIPKGYTHEAVAGQSIQQSVTVKFRADEPVIVRNTNYTRKQLLVGKSSKGTIPNIGFGMTQEPITLTAQEQAVLSKLEPDHIRVDLHLSEKDFISRFNEAKQVSNFLGCSLEVALYLEEMNSVELEKLSLHLQGTQIVRFLIFQESARTSHPSETTSTALMQFVNVWLKPVAPHAQYIGGTDLNFCELNRTRPDVSVMDGICYSIHPQEHAFDDLSVIETMQAQAETVQTAKGFSGDKSIVVSPITLKRRSNPNETVPGKEIDIFEATKLPENVDSRQLSLLGAGWTLGSIKYLAEAGVHSVTYYELIGWRGLLEAINGPDRPKAFPSKPGMVFPIYHLFADLAELKSDSVLVCESSHPLEHIGLAVKKGEGLSLLVANLTADTQEILIPAIDNTKALVRRLNESNIETAMFEPLLYRSSYQEVHVLEGNVSFCLSPYEYVRIDI